MLIEELGAEVWEVLGCEEPMTQAYILETFTDIKLFDKKHHDRGPRNILEFGESGVLVRCFDKLARLKRLVWEGVAPKVSEPVEAEWRDLSVYGVIARLVRKGVWERAEEKVACCSREVA